MKVTMRLTLDGLVRAMRVTAHQVADAVESGADEGSTNPHRTDARERTAVREGDRHDRSDP